MKRAEIPTAVSRVLIVVFCMLLVITAGCTSAGKQREAYWNSRLGSATYDDVAAQLGPPAAKETLSDKSIVAKWIRRSQSVNSSELWNEELVMRFSPGGILTQCTLHEY